MIDQLREELLTKIDYVKEEERKEIVRALEYASKFEEGIKDFNGNHYFLHVLRTAIILTDIHSDYICIVSSLIGWLPRKVAGIELDELENLFGQKVREIVESSIKVSNLKLKDTDELSAFYLRKAMVGLSADVRVIIMTLAAHLDDMREIYTKPSKEQREKCLEAESVLIPIAHRLGINYIKSELEDLCLKYTKPDIYEEILENLNADYDELQGYIDEMKNSLSAMMNEHDISFRIKGRVKSVHSIYTKLAKGKRWSEIYDILALRIIVKKEAECYLAIGLIHAKYRPLPKRFKDYIAQPKENMYQSLHTGIIGPNGKIFEIQIRTEDMDEIAEYGIASHWSYKEHGAKAIQNLMEQKLELFRNSMDLTENDDASTDTFEEVFLSDMIYVFTPKGDVLELPVGSTAVDFAYRIHSHVGDTLVGAIVNDQIVPVDKPLKNNDIVKIMTNESSVPNKDWLKFVKTSQAKNKIKSYFNKLDRENYIVKGEDLINKEIKRRHWVASEVLTDENIEKLTKILKLKDYDEIKLSVGSMRYTANYVMSLLVEEKQNVSDLILEIVSGDTKKSVSNKNDIVVDGCKDILITTANCCKPVYGDEIIGYITKGEGIVVHKTTCTNIKNMESRFIDVRWNNTQEGSYTTGLLVRGNSTNNDVLAIVTKCAQRELSIESIDALNRGDHLDYEILIRVPNKEKLKQFMVDLESLPFVNSVERELK